MAERRRIAAAPTLIARRFLRRARRRGKEQSRRKHSTSASSTAESEQSACTFDQAEEELASLLQRVGFRLGLLRPPRGSGDDEDIGDTIAGVTAVRLLLDRCDGLLDIMSVEAGGCGHSNVEDDGIDDDDECALRVEGCRDQVRALHEVCDSIAADAGVFVAGTKDEIPARDSTRCSRGNDGDRAATKKKSTARTVDSSSDYDGKRGKPRGRDERENESKGMFQRNTPHSSKPERHRGRFTKPAATKKEYKASATENACEVDEKRGKARGKGERGSERMRQRSTPHSHRSPRHLDRRSR